MNSGAQGDGSEGVDAPPLPNDEGKTLANLPGELFPEPCAPVLSDKAEDTNGEKKSTVRMVRVVNTSNFRSLHLGFGKKIGPGQTGKIPLSEFKKISAGCTWLKRAERGDVI